MANRIEIEYLDKDVWKIKTSKSCGKKYYYNKITKKSHWNLPSSEDEEGSSKKNKEHEKGKSSREKLKKDKCKEKKQKIDSPPNKYSDNETKRKTRSSANKEDEKKNRKYDKETTKKSKRERSLSKEKEETKSRKRERSKEANEISHRNENNSCSKSGQNQKQVISSQNKINTKSAVKSTTSLTLNSPARMPLDIPLPPGSGRQKKLTPPSSAKQNPVKASLNLNNNSKNVPAQDTAKKTQGKAGKADESCVMIDSLNGVIDLCTPEPPASKRSKVETRAAAVSLSGQQTKTKDSSIVDLCTPTSTKQTSQTKQLTSQGSTNISEGSKSNELSSGAINVLQKLSRRQKLKRNRQARLEKEKAAQLNPGSTSNQQFHINVPGITKTAEITKSTREQWNESLSNWIIKDQWNESLEEDMEVEDMGEVVLLNLQEARKDSELNSSILPQGELTQTVIDASVITIEDSPVKKKKGLVLVVDTNVLISCLSWLGDLLEADIPGYGCPLIVLPWVVLQELDYIKDNKKHGRYDSVTVQQAVRAVHLIHGKLKARDPQLVGQTPKEAFEKTEMNINNNDDRILMCCLQWQDKAKEDSVLLVTRDVNLSNKSLISGVPAVNTETLWEQLKMKKPNLKALKKGCQYADNSSKPPSSTMKPGCPPAAASSRAPPAANSSQPRPPSSQPPPVPLMSVPTSSNVSCPPVNIPNNLRQNNCNNPPNNISNNNLRQNSYNNPPNNFVSAMNVLGGVRPVARTVNPQNAIMNNFLNRLSEYVAPRFGVQSQPQRYNNANVMNPPYNRNSSNLNENNTISNTKNNNFPSVNNKNKSSIDNSVTCNNQQKNNLNCLDKTVSNKNAQNKVNLNIPTRSSPRNASTTTPNKFKKIAEKLATSVIEILDSPALVSASPANRLSIETPSKNVLSHESDNEDNMDHAPSFTEEATLNDSMEAEKCVMTKFETVWRLIFDTKAQLADVLKVGASHEHFGEAQNVIVRLVPLTTNLHSSFSKCLDFSPMIVEQQTKEFSSFAYVLNSFASDSQLAVSGETQPVAIDALAKHFGITDNRPQLQAGLQQLTEALTELQAMQGS